LTDRDHLLNRLASHPQFPGQISLREALGQQRIDQPAPLLRQITRRERVFDRCRPDLLQLVEAFGVSCGLDVFDHERTMTTLGCLVNPWLS